jgi:hypothetical protein
LANQTNNPAKAQVAAAREGALKRDMAKRGESATKATQALPTGG